ncbi:S-adenosyl-L-methionine-dependent methyltransferase [Cadophora sp. DSE1049]|nr:S-adenosyl-L-methionine-dependent methyltransferase [Cadophora sp. DSE1049]
MSPLNLVTLAASLREALDSPLDIQSKAEREARLEIIDMIPALNRKLIGEVQTIRDMAWEWLNVLSLKAVSHWSIAKRVPLDEKISYTDLSTKCGLEPIALRRLMRHAMSNGIFYEPAKDFIAHNSVSQILVNDPRTAAWVELQTETILLGGAHHCEALDKWPGSESKRETGVSIGFHNPGQTSLYEEVKKIPERVQRFGLAMELFSSGEGYEPISLVEGYDWEKLGEGTVVDVGGGNGFASSAISDAFPALKLIVQDIDVTDDIQTEHKRQNIQFQKHDFFTPQIVKGADVYIYRWIFHNWGDDESVEILQAAIPALKPGAKILINDGCLPVPGTGHLFEEKASRNLDICMMVAMNAKEREEGDWEALFQKADPRFKYLGAKRPDGSRMSLIEAEWIGE